MMVDKKKVVIWNTFSYIIIICCFLLTGCKENVRYEIETLFTGTITDAEYMFYDNDPTDEDYHTWPMEVTLTNEFGEEKVLDGDDFLGSYGVVGLGVGASIEGEYENQVKSMLGLKLGDRLVLKRECKYKTDIFGNEKLVYKIPFVVRVDV